MFFKHKYILGIYIRTKVSLSQNLCWRSLNTLFFLVRLRESKKKSRFITKGNEYCQIIILMILIQSSKVVFKSSDKIPSTHSGTVLENPITQFQKQCFPSSLHDVLKQTDSMGPGSKPQIQEMLGKNSTTVKTVCRKFIFIAASLKDISINYWFY